MIINVTARPQRLLEVWWCKYVSVKWIIICSGNGMSPSQRQASAPASVDLLSVGCIWTNFYPCRWLLINIFAIKCYVYIVWVMGKPWHFSVNKSYYYNCKKKRYMKCSCPGQRWAKPNMAMHDFCSGGNQSYGCSTRCAIWLLKYESYVILYEYVYLTSWTGYLN